MDVGIQGSKADNIPSGHAFAMTCREEENSGFYIQKTHVTDKKKKKKKQVNRNNVGPPYDESVIV